MSEWTKLTRRDLLGFDDQATELILEMGEHGWIGRISSKNHAIMRDANSEETYAVSRDSKRARSGRNARAFFNRWLRAQAPSELILDPLECGVCHEKFSSGRALGAHRKKHAPPVPCPVCGKPFKYLARHLKVHESRPQKTLSEKLLDLAAEAEKLEQELEEGQRNGA